ncbi:MAG: hypothetical protein ABI897_02440 [Spartobacteria bacterium]
MLVAVVLAPAIGRAGAGAAWTRVIGASSELGAGLAAIGASDEAGAKAVTVVVVVAGAAGTFTWGVAAEVLSWAKEAETAASESASAPKSCLVDVDIVD